jgi:hypothetical protein
MSQPVKLLLDECLGRPIVLAMNEMFSWENPRPTINHLTNYFVPGTLDPDWIPKIKGQGWIIISQDKGSKGRNKLPQICTEYGITHIILSKAVGQLKQQQKANQIISVWEDIKKCYDEPPGTRFRLKLTSAGRAAIEKVTPPPSASKRQA